MEDKKRNTIYAVLIVGCLVVAGVITYVTRSPGGSGVPKHFAGQSVWVKCINQDCGGAYEMDMKEFFDRREELMVLNPTGIEAPPLECKECGEESIYDAVKCGKCELVFFQGASGRDQFPDKCPECGYSKKQEDRRKAAEARAARRKAREGE